MYVQIGRRREIEVHCVEETGMSELVTSPDPWRRVSRSSLPESALCIFADCKVIWSLEIVLANGLAE